MNRSFLLIVLSISIFGWTSCGHSVQSEDIRQFIHSSVEFPTSLRTHVLRKDTIIPNILATNFKLVIYINSTECDDCKLQVLRSWTRHIEDLQKMLVADSHCIFIFHPKHLEAMESGLITYDFDRPVLYDCDGSFEQSNPELPQDPLFHTFLLDRNNRVVLVGSPIGNSKMWELYKATIRTLAENDGLMPTE